MKRKQNSQEIIIESMIQNKSNHQKDEKSLLDINNVFIYLIKAFPNLFSQTYKQQTETLTQIILITILYQFSLQKMNTEKLRYYYQHLYPYETIYKWLTYNGQLPFEHRELSFQYENQSVQRYVKFKSAKEMKNRMTSVDDDPPRKLDAGAIWTGPPSKDNKQFTPMQRQFIFDFDMNDYDDVRKCCEGKNTCQLCWKFMIVAKEVITRTLKEDFGFQKFIYVFSGGRGMHIWVCDQQARKMHDSLRKSIVDYLEVVTGNHKADSLLADNTLPLECSKVYNRVNQKNKDIIKEQMFSQMNPHITRSLEIIKKWFKQIFEDQKAFTDPKCRQVIYRILQRKNKKLKERVIQRWSKCDQSIQTMWSQLCKEVDHYELTTTDQQYPLMREQELDSRKYQRISFIEQEIALSFLYPRMDYAVSTSQNHLLKLPFSIHPGTSKVSVPLFSSQVQKFNPGTCIKLQNLMKQLTQLEVQNALSYENTEQNAHKTGLCQYLRAMQNFCQEF